MDPSENGVWNLWLRTTLPLFRTPMTVGEIRGCTEEDVNVLVGRDLIRSCKDGTYRLTDRGELVLSKVPAKPRTEGGE